MPASSWIVVKFGGTSVSSLESWRTIARVVAERRREGLRPLVVCSAVAGVTDELARLLDEAASGDSAPVLEGIRARHQALGEALEVDASALDEELRELARLASGVSLVREASPRVRARVLAMGPRMSTRLGAAFLVSQGQPAAWLDARDCLASNDHSRLSSHRRYLSASCGFDPDPELQQRLSALAAGVLVTQGFIARDAEGDTVLLGRGGSDTAAACLAAQLQAARCEIWTDEPGLYSANPRQVPEARLLRRLDYSEAQELASTGAKALHPRCIAPVRRHGIPLHLRCIGRPGLEGTVVGPMGDDRGAPVKAICSREGVMLVSMETPGMWQQVGFLADAFAVFKRHGLSIDLVSTSQMNVTVSLDPAANRLEPSSLRGLLAELEGICSPRLIGPCAVVSLVGSRIRAVLPRLGSALEVFEERQIHLVSQAASDLNLSFVVDEGDADRLVGRLHRLLFDPHRDDVALGPTWREQEAAALAPRDSAPQPWWRGKREALLALAARAPLYVYDAQTLDDSVAKLQSIRALDRALYAMKANPNPEILRRFERAGLGFECVSPGEIDQVLETLPGLAPERILFTPNFAPRLEYERAFERGVRVTVDAVFPLLEWPEVFAGRELFVRLDPGHGRGHHPHVRTAGVQSKFGISPALLDTLLEGLARSGAKVVGLHAHCGSGILEPETWAETAVFLAQLAERFPEASILDLGGGLGVAERPGQSGLDLEAVGERLGQFKEAHPRFRLWMEPGRLLVAEAGVLLARVTQVKRKGEHTYVGVETGMNSLLRPALYGAWHEIVNLSRLDEPATLTADVVGPVCESGDVLGHGRRIARAREGDLILIATAGAYGRAMSSRYNLRDPADEHLLDR